MFGFHTQITLVAPAAANRSWMCRQAATNSAGVAWVVPHGYQLPFISCPKLSATGPWNAATALAKLLT